MASTVSFQLFPRWVNHVWPCILKCTRPAGFTFDPATAEFAIAYGYRSSWADDEPLLIASETITPVCHPVLGETIASVDDLWGLPLLGDQNLAIDWPTFAEATGSDPSAAARIRPATTFNHSHLALRAAAAGQGVALASSPPR